MRKRVHPMAMQLLYTLIMMVLISIIVTLMADKFLKPLKRRIKPITDFDVESVTKSETDCKLQFNQETSALRENLVKTLNINDEKYEKLNALFPIPIAVGEKKDWNDYALMRADERRQGEGEQGRPTYISLYDNVLQKELEHMLIRENGFNALVSDHISENRSLPDARNEACRSLLYLAKLPTVSIVITCYEEYFSVLLRTLHSIVNRTPKELLQEIIIVDDNSDLLYLKAELEDYVSVNFNGLVKILRLKERTGFIGARLAGAKAATADVLVFLESHIECNYNWLPPLLEPIAVNAQVVTCPMPDVIEHDTFAYSRGEDCRGAFDWSFSYKELPLRAEELADKTKLYHNPIMISGLFAIQRQFFWQLGGYDEALDDWGGEQYDLSFKIWMCGGMLLNVPCSRVAHIYRGPMDDRPIPRDNDFLHRNYKRLAEVWLDEYKQYFYEHDTTIFEVDAGNVSAQLALRERLKCKSFKWFLDVVAHVPDRTTPPDYASGTLESVLFPQNCLDTMHGDYNNPLGLYYCDENMTHPEPSQFWRLSFYRDLRLRNEVCLDAAHHASNDGKLWLCDCHQRGVRQLWYYQRDKQWLRYGKDGEKCLEAGNELDIPMTVRLSRCDNSVEGMKWSFAFVNDTMLDNYFHDL